MANVATNVSTGKPNISGGVWVAPLGTVIPESATSALPEACVCLGYVSEDGLTNANDMEVNEIKAWGGMIVYRSLTSLNDTFKFSLIESENADVLKAVYGSENVTVDASGNVAISIKAEDPEEKVFVFELALRGGRKKRIVVKDGAITARDEIVYNDSDAIAYGITVSAYPDADGNTHQEYMEGASVSI